MGRSQRLMLAGAGLVGLVAWHGYGLALDAELMHRLQNGVVSGPVTVFCALRLGLPLVDVALACVALLQTIRDRRARGWFLAVLLILLGPLVLRGLPPRLLSNLPYYLLSAVYLVLVLSVEAPSEKEKVAPRSTTPV